MNNQGNQVCVNERYLEEQEIIREAVASRNKNIDIIMQSKLDEENDKELQRKLSYKMAKIFKKDQAILAELSSSESENISMRITQKKYYKNPAYNHRVEDDEDPTPSVSFPRRISLSIANAFKYNTDEDEFIKRPSITRRFSLTLSRAFKNDDDESFGRKISQKFLSDDDSDDGKVFRVSNLFKKKKKKEKISLYHDLVQSIEAKKKKRWFS